MQEVVNGLRFDTASMFRVMRLQRILENGDLATVKFYAESVKQ